MKHLLLTGLCALSAIGFAQTSETPSGAELAEPSFCGHTEAQERLFELHPEYKEAFIAEQATFQNQSDADWEVYSEGERATKTVTIVFHVVHLGGDENISDDQIYDGIVQLNADFSETNVDLGSTIAAFSGITGNTDFNFVLAKKDPWGNCHSGITRTYSSTTYDVGMGASSHPIVEAVRAQHGTWPQNRYMNVFVCIDPAGAAGYTFKPAGWIPITDMYAGIFIRHTYVGVIGTSSAGKRHTLSHEAGHWFNLNHTWGGSNSPGDPTNCTINDGVSDTPNTIGWSSCNLAGTSCSSLDNVQNIMEYSYCSTMFTDGQASRMNTAINSNTADRDNLWTASTLASTGADGPGVLCEALFSSDETVICAGQDINYSDESFFNVTGWTWSFEGGTPASSTVENPTVTYNTGGTYNVTLTVTDGSGFETLTLTDYVTVLNDPGGPLPYSEGFETLANIEDDQRFFLWNENGNDQWTITSTASASGSKSAWLNNYGNFDGTIDELISGPIDLSTVDPADDFIFSFDYAYIKRSASNNELLKVYISKDCGTTWALRLNLDSDDMTTLANSSSWTPDSADEWTNEIITTVTNSYYVSNFMYKFQFTNDNGNNVYLDNINLYPASMTLLPEGDNSHTLSVYPNPTSNNVTVEIKTANADDYTIELYNALGARISTIYSGSLSVGLNKFEYSTDALAKGVYVIKVGSQGNYETLKLIKE